MCDNQTPESTNTQANDTPGTAMSLGIAPALACRTTRSDLHPAGAGASSRSAGNMGTTYPDFGEQFDGRSYRIRIHIRRRS